MNSTPRVSICIPNLNMRSYLPERFETIFAQTLTDWEAIVVDSFSEDESWEYIQALAAAEPRMKISQAPRGLYTSLNRCIEQARGDFVYIATSDDTMTPGCLEKMTAVLDANLDCGIAQCALEVIAADGISYPPERQWEHYTLGSYDPNLVRRGNKRFAPHDGMVHPALYTIYTSLTQLLIRRQVFEQVGLFDNQWGSSGDFEWGMRAGLVENCIYIAERLATWRRHPQQATQEVDSPQHRLRAIEMTRAAFERAKKCDGALLNDVDIDDLLYFLERDVVAMEFHEARSIAQRCRAVLVQLLRRPQATIEHIWERLQGKRWTPANCAGRYMRLENLLRKYRVPTPIFESGNHCDRLGQVDSGR